ncbi:MAG: D-2-hydroxyacid dehydrogenase [Andreesenia angusta]|nr:D-2-hydroxyacid dehydrogenase [Andreesenia angusta]
MKIAILDYETLGDDIKLDKFSEFGELELFKRLSREEILERVEDKDIVIINKIDIDKEFLDRAKKLKMVAITATGYNNVDLDYAKEKGVKVYNVAGYSTESVVQHTFSMALSMLNHISSMEDYVRTGKYTESNMMTRLDMPIRQLSDLKWGIIGLGDIGKRVADIANAFDAEVVYNSPREMNCEYRRLELDELLKYADIISIHCPLNQSTDRLIDYSKLKLMKKDAIILNLARGGIIVEEDLIRALNEDIIGGACLDVFEREPIDGDNKLLNISKDKLIMTPHIAWAGLSARRKLIEGVYNNIKSFIEDGEIEPLN